MDLWIAGSTQSWIIDHVWIRQKETSTPHVPFITNFNYSVNAYSKTAIDGAYFPSLLDG